MTQNFFLAILSRTFYKFQQVSITRWIVSWYIGLATKRLRILSIPPNDKTRNHLVAKPYIQSQ